MEKPERAKRFLQIIELLKGLSDEERKEMLEMVGDIYCPHCGICQPVDGQQCQCWNDE
jgi:hypothetical protein